MYQRYLQPVIEELLPEFRVLCLTGSRQAGKTTIVRDIAEKQGIQYLTLDDQATFNAAKQDPHGLIRSLGDKRVAIDEFQAENGAKAEQIAQLTGYSIDQIQSILKG